MLHTLEGHDHRFGHSNRQISNHRMRNQTRLKKKIDDLQRQSELLNETLSGLNEQRILETRFEEKLRLRKFIDDTQTHRDQVDEQLKNMEESQLTKVDSDAKEVTNQNKEVAGRDDDQGPLESRFSYPEQPVTAASAYDVAIDVDNCIGDNQSFNRQFLSLVATRLPDRLSALVQAYAQSRMLTARRESLIVASQAGLSADIDTLLDAWVAGSKLEPGCFPRDQELIPNPDQQPFVNSLALAVLRQYDSEPEVARDILTRLPHNLSTVCRLRFKEIKLDDFLKEANPEEYLLAARAGVEMSFSIAPYVHRQGIWWLLMALPLHHDHVVDLLRLPKEDRAVLGLVTATEWDAMGGDEGLKRRIVEYRRGRPVYRRS